MNKELEEAAERAVIEWNGNIGTEMQDCFIAGAKWQQGRSYSEEEVIELLEYTRKNFYDTGTKWHSEPDTDYTSKELIEHFKKK